MRLRLNRLRHNVAGPLVDPLLSEPWRIGSDREINDEVGAKLLEKYPDFFSKYEPPKDPLEKIKKIKPKQDKMMRVAKDKASGS